MSGETNSGKSRDATAKQSGPRAAKHKRPATSGIHVNRAAKTSGTAVISNDTGRAVTKARRTVTLDVDVVAELDRRDGSLSAQLNEWARRGMEWDTRQAQILELVADYEAEFGEIDEADVKRWEDILS